MHILYADAVGFGIAHMLFKNVFQRFPVHTFAIIPNLKDNISVFPESLDFTFI